MPIKVDMTSPDVDKQIELLKFYPEIVIKHYRPALQEAVSIIESQIQPNIPIGASKRLSSTFGSKVSGRTIETMKGELGWFSGKIPRYAHLVEDGAAAHSIDSYAPGLGVYIKKHPGLSGVGFMAAGYSATQPIVESLLSRASDGVVKEMAVP